jgi:hypothetical protein
MANTSPASLLEQFVKLAESLALGEGGTIENSDSTTQTVNLFGKAFKVTEEATEKVTVTPA